MIRRQLRPFAVRLALYFGIREPDYGTFRLEELQAYVAALPPVKEG